jgi:hypothetical protein
MEKDSGWVSLIGIIIFIFILSKVFGWGKYEGQTAKEWYNEYDWVVGCVEDASTLSEAQNCL